MADTEDTIATDAKKSKKKAKTMGDPIVTIEQ